MEASNNQWIHKTEMQRMNTIFTSERRKRKRVRRKNYWKEKLKTVKQNRNTKKKKKYIGRKRQKNTKINGKEIKWRKEKELHSRETAGFWTCCGESLCNDDDDDDKE